MAAKAGRLPAALALVALLVPLALVLRPSGDTFVGTSLRDDDEEDEEDFEEEYDDEDDEAICDMKLHAGVILTLLLLQRQDEVVLVPEELKADYAFDEVAEGDGGMLITAVKVVMAKVMGTGVGEPPKAWYKQRHIDRHKVNMKFFDIYKKPVDFFPHRLQAGDTVRVYYLEAKPGSGDKEVRGIKLSKDQLRETYFDGTILNFRGEYHSRTMTVRAMIGKGLSSVGYEFQFPMHSPLITRIQVMRRGFIGRNKNAYFLRGMVGKRNIIPIDKERTEMDKRYSDLRLDGREDEIPDPEYPQQEWDTYPLPVWKQDMADWNEEEYDPSKVDQRSDYETRVIAKYRMRPDR
ncbi:rplS [Symbiodinium sp. CCMP2592]|nr:rplS [Symbiodinium sp. CCMP2592]